MQHASTLQHLSKPPTEAVSAAVFHVPARRTTYQKFSISTAPANAVPCCEQVSRAHWPGVLHADCLHAHARADFGLPSEAMERSGEDEEDV
jgi:hypothetical protein